MEGEVGDALKRMALGPTYNDEMDPSVRVSWFWCGVCAAALCAKRQAENESFLPSATIHLSPRST